MGLRIKDAIGLERVVASTMDVVGDDLEHTPHHRDPEAIAALNLIHADLGTTLAAYLDGLESLIGTTNVGNAAILAKLSADPATQATLAAVLAKLPVGLGTGGGLKVDGSGAALPVTGSGYFAAVGATMQRPADTSGYSVGDIVAQNTLAASCSGVAVAVARANDATGMLRRCRVKVNDAAWLNAQLYIHVFKDTPTFANGDNAAFAAGLTESNYIGAFDVTLDRSFSDPLVKGIGAPRAGSEMNFDAHAGSPNLYYVIETRTAVAVPGSGKIFTVVFEVLQN
ncbi:hypothetical protein [Mesorhizobium sp. M0522]|uniref:hypothetical protein n=1 Tax=Mesorhizobium sp. M0522 TaxID=2956958 RepID=UPI003335130A